MGLNKVLENMLVAMDDEYGLRSWAVFNEKNGNVTVRIRFENGGNAVKREEVSYRRKTPGQLRRDQRRSEQWRCQQANPPTDSQPVQLDSPAEAPQEAPHCENTTQELATEAHIVHSGMVTRSRRQEGTPETQRCDSSREDIPSVCSPSELNPLAPSFAASPVCASADVDVRGCIVEEESQSLLQLPLLDTVEEEEESRDPSPTPVIPASDSSSGSDDESRAGNSVAECQRPRCGYGNGKISDSDSMSNMFRCAKCETANGSLFICGVCLDGGRHTKHRKYMVKADTL